MDRLARDSITQHFAFMFAASGKLLPNSASTESSCCSRLAVVAKERMGQSNLEEVQAAYDVGLRSKCKPASSINPLVHR